MSHLSKSSISYDILTLRGRVQQTGVRINDYSELDTDWGLANSTQADLRMQERLHYKAGCYITYSGIRAGLGMSVGRKSAEESTSLYLGCINSYYGLTAQYNNIKEKVSSDVHSQFRRQSPLRQLPLQHRLTG